VSSFARSPRAAFALLPAALIVPLISSPLAGLTHPPTCRIAPGEPITIASTSEDDEGESSIAASAISIEPPTETESPPCPGVSLQMNVTTSADGSSVVVLPVSNNTSSSINVTIDVHVGSDKELLRLSRINPGRVGVRTFTITSVSGRQQSVRAGAYIGAA
jgi:hypothetical protein